MKKWQHAARDQHEFSSQGFFGRSIVFLYSISISLRFRALTLGDICFEQNCKKVQDLVDELCDFEASK